MNNKTEGEVVAEIRFMGGEDAERSFLIVEGSDDTKFWKTRVHNKCVVVNASCKNIGLKAVRKLNGRGYVGHIGVFDRDYDDALTPSDFRQNILFWNGHSLEAILFFSNAAERLIAERMAGDRLATCEVAMGTTLRAHVEMICLEVGRIRYLQFLSAAPVEDGDLSPHRFVPRNTNLSFDIGALHAKAVELGIVPSLQQVAGYIGSIPHALLNRFLTRGHDLTALLASVFGDYGGGGKVKDIEAGLRLAFHRADLELTTVFHELRSWEAVRTPRRILA